MVRGPHSLQRSCWLMNSWRPLRSRSLVQASHGGGKLTSISGSPAPSRFSPKWGASGWGAQGILKPGAAPEG